MNLFQRFKEVVRENRGTLVALVLLLAFRSSYADWMIVPTGSMNPTIIEGDYIFTDKHAYGLRIPFTQIRLTKGDDPQRGDIAVFYSPADGTRLVKRVIGVPGDTVEMRDEVLFINGQRLQYTQHAPVTQLLNTTLQTHPAFATEHLATTPHAVMLLPYMSARRDFDPIAIPAGQYLMLGDNRDNSADSRYFGLVPREQFVGRAHHLLVSLDPEHYYRPRLNRIWQPLT